MEFDGHEYNFGFARDITARKRTEQELRRVKKGAEAAHRELVRQARTDPMTGILNRRAVLEHLGKEVARTRRQHTPLGVAMIDVDHFKQVNDAYGHAAGDQVLCEVASRALAALRPYDVLGRMGGEEFLVVVPGTPCAELHGVLERIRIAVGTPPILVEGHLLNIAVSIGGTAEAWGSVDALIRAADEALYRAKSEGRDRVVVADEICLMV